MTRCAKSCSGKNHALKNQKVAGFEKKHRGKRRKSMEESILAISAIIVIAVVLSLVTADLKDE